MRPSRRTRRCNRWGSLLVLTVLAALFLANLPFYSGSSLGPSLAWRLEGARLNITRRPSRNPESFYIAINSEPLRWNWDARYNAPGDWYISIPLWTPILLALAWTLFAWWPARRRFDPRNPRCPSCGYALASIPPNSPCPECGKPAPR